MKVIDILQKGVYNMIKHKEVTYMRQKLIEARGEKTQTEVAKNIGISQKYLSKLELGKRTPSMHLASKIGKYYNLSLEDLFPDIFLD